MSRAALAEDHAELPGKARITYEKIRLHLEENFGVETDRARVARLFGLNPGYLSRLFAEHGERGFSETLLEIRMAYAAMLLRETELLVDEVAFRCGYRSTTFFSAVFRNCHGMPPGAVPDAGSGDPGPAAQAVAPGSSALSSMRR